MSAPAISVIVSTYQRPEALDVVLSALSEQWDPSVEIVVADDGSGVGDGGCRRVWQSTYADALKHVWQPDLGFRKARVLNLGALAAGGDYLLFLDGDCVPRQGFLDVIRRAAIPGWFLASKRLAMSRRAFATCPRRTTPGLALVRSAVVRPRPRRVRRGLHMMLAAVQACSSRFAIAGGLGERGQPGFVPPYGGYGSPLGVARERFERVNGFDMRFVGWGGEDVDIAVRLRRLGLRCGWPGSRATMLHLWHPKRKGTTRSNTPLREATVASTRIEAVEGLRELERELAA